jgi:hypothetical protein
MFKFIKRFFKFIFISLAVVLVLLIIGIGVGLYYLDTLLKRGIENGGSAALGVPTQVDVAHLGLFTGELSLKKFQVANPEGYSAPHFMTIGNLDAAVTLNSLTKDTIEVPYLKLTDVYVSLEKKENKANYDVILANIKEFQKQFKSSATEKTPGQPGTQASSSSKRFVIKEISIKNVKVDAQVKTLGGLLGSSTMRVEIPEIVVKNVGTEEGNAVAIEEVTGVVTAAVLKAVLEQGGGVLPPEIARGLGAGLGALGGLGGGTVQVIGTVGKGVLDGTGKLIEGTGKALGDIGKGIGEIFEGDKKAPADRKE